MAKTSYQRHQVERLKNKWSRLNKHLDFISDPSLSFGKIFKKDPLDCGNTKCAICSRGKLFSNRKKYNWTQLYYDEITNTRHT